MKSFEQLFFLLQNHSSEFICFQLGLHWTVDVNENRNGEAVHNKMVDNQDRNLPYHLGMVGLLGANLALIEPNDSHDVVNCPHYQSHQQSEIFHPNGAVLLFGQREKFLILEVSDHLQS